jgi:hypothetical protein
MSEMDRPERLQIILTREELAALDDWRFANRMPTRAAAIRALMRRGMEVRVDGSGALMIRRSRDVRLVERRPNGGNGAGSHAAD